MRKKRGSSLLLVLGITFILITVGGIVTTSVMHTTGQHNNVKVESDLTYAAESGIESAFSNIKEKKIQLSPGETNTPYNIDSFFLNENIKVKIEISRDIDKYNVISTAKRGDKETKVKSSIKVDTRVDGNNSIFKYLLCSKEADMRATGGLDGVVSLWNITDQNNSKFVHNIIDNNSNNLPDDNEGQEMSIRIEAEDFVIPKFKATGRKDSLKISQVSQLDIYSSDKESGINKIEKFGVSIYLVNFESENSVLEIMGNPSMNQQVIITNGIVKLGNNDYNLVASPALVLTKSTICARRIDTRISTFHSTYRLIDNDNKAEDILNEEKLSQLNSELEIYIKNWNSNLGTVTEDVIIGDVEYIE